MTFMRIRLEFANNNLQAIMSLQSACAAQLAPHESQGTAVGALMGSVALT